MNHEISGIIALSIGGLVTSICIRKLALSILNAYMPPVEEGR